MILITKEKTMQKMRPATILAALLICSAGAVLAQVEIDGVVTDEEAEEANAEANNPLPTPSLSSYSQSTLSSSGKASTPGARRSDEHPRDPGSSDLDCS